MAGGIDALVESVEGAEDDEDTACIEVARLALQPCDVVIGVAASGSTPYTLAVMQEASKAGALLIAIANNAESSLAAASDFAVTINTEGGSKYAFYRCNAAARTGIPRHDGSYADRKREAFEPGSQLDHDSGRCDPFKSRRLPSSVSWANRQCRVTGLGGHVRKGRAFANEARR